MEFQVYDVAVIPVIIALIQLFKQVGLPNRFAPIVSIALGIVAGFVYIAPGDPAKAVYLGIVIGLSAIGLFSGAKNTVK